MGRPLRPGSNEPWGNITLLMLLALALGSIAVGVLLYEIARESGFSLNEVRSRGQG